MITLEGAHVGGGPRASVSPSRSCTNGYRDGSQGTDEGNAERKRDISPAESLPRKRKSESVEEEEEDASKKMRVS